MAAMGGSWCSEGGRQRGKHQWAELSKHFRAVQTMCSCREHSRVRLRNVLHTYTKAPRAIRQAQARGVVNLPDFESQRLSAHPILYFIDPPASLRNEGSKSGSPFDGRVWPGACEDDRGHPNGIRSLSSPCSLSGPHPWASVLWAQP